MKSSSSAEEVSSNTATATRTGASRWRSGCSAPIFTTTVSQQFNSLGADLLFGKYSNVYCVRWGESGTLLKHPKKTKSQSTSVSSVVNLWLLFDKNEISPSAAGSKLAMSWPVPQSVPCKTKTNWNPCEYPPQTKDGSCFFCFFCALFPQSDLFLGRIKSVQGWRSIRWNVSFACRLREAPDILITKYWIYSLPEYNPSLKLGSAWENMLFQQISALQSDLCFVGSRGSCVISDSSVLKGFLIFLLQCFFRTMKG